MLLHELVHRSKNILTLVQAMIRQLGRENKSIPEFQKEVDHRLRGLGMSIRALAEVQWQGLPIRKLIETHLDVFGTVAQRIMLVGDDFMLSPEAAQNFGLVIHEATTNSIKYGALSAPSGKITVRWQSLEKDGRQMIHLVWTETGGPPARAKPQGLRHHGHQKARGRRLRRAGGDGISRIRLRVVSGSADPLFHAQTIGTDGHALRPPVGEPSPSCGQQKAAQNG